MEEQQCFECNICGFVFKHKSSLSRHKKECKAENEVKNNIEKEVNSLKEQLEKQKIMYEEQMEKQKLMYEERIQDLKQQITQQQTTISSLIEANKQQPSNEIYNPYNPPLATNVISLPVKQPFSLEKYLNVDCKDAINFDEFCQNFVIEWDDIIKITSKTIHDVMVKLLIKNTKKYETTKRPFNVSNLRDKVFWIKSENKWVKDEKLFIKKIWGQICNEILIYEKNQLKKDKKYIDKNGLNKDKIDKIEDGILYLDEEVATKIFNQFLEKIVIDKK